MTGDVEAAGELVAGRPGQPGHQPAHDDRPRGDPAGARLAARAGRPPGRLRTTVGARGARLATGERQLIAFLRAWIADPAVLVLDEATSSLDLAAEARITEALTRLRTGRTTVIIAHRMSTVLDEDQIAVVADGRIAECGPPGELLVRNGRFAGLYEQWRRGASG